MTLPLTTQDLRRAFSQGKRFKYVFFWGHRPKQIGIIDKSCFSQWFPAKFKIDGNKFGSSEHYMMAEKARLFDDAEMLDKILNAPNPGAAKQFGRQVRGFVEEVWQDKCFDIVVKGYISAQSTRKSSNPTSVIATADYGSSSEDFLRTGPIISY